jgi:hypothetical protein
MNSTLKSLEYSNSSIEMRLQQKGLERPVPVFWPASVRFGSAPFRLPTAILPASVAFAIFEDA